MDLETQRILQSELMSSERLLWAGRPKQGVILRGTDIFLIPFSVLWCGFAVVWEVTAAASGAPPFFLLFGGLFVIFGLYFVFGRFIVDSHQRSKTHYAITDQRLIIKSGSKVKSLNLRTLSDISLSERPNREGTIQLGADPFGAWFQGMSWPGMPEHAPRFERIPNAREIYEILLRAKQES